MKKETFGTILALIAAIISGFAIPINKIFVSGLDPVIFTAIRGIVVGIIFFFLASAQSKFHFKKIKKVSWKWLIAIGIIGGGLAFLAYFTGLSFTTAGRAAFLHKTLPIYVTIFAFIFLKEKVAKKQGFALLIMLIGTFVIMSTQINPATFWTDPAFGDILVLLGTILWGVENVIAKHAMLKEESNWTVSFARMFIGGIFLFVIAFSLGKAGMLLTLSPNQIVSVIISTGILFAYVFSWYWSIRLINVSKAAALLLIAPVISLVLGVVLFGEPAPLLQIVGSVLILIGAAFVVRIKSELVSGV
jgi:drug/metabolite transporter (DMT)-like permease